MFLIKLYWLFSAALLVLAAVLLCCVCFFVGSKKARLRDAKNHQLDLDQNADFKEHSVQTPADDFQENSVQTPVDDFQDSSVQTADSTFDRE